MKLPQPLMLQRPDHRAEVDRVRAAFKAALDTLAFDEAVAELAALGTALDQAVARAKRELLASSLCWNENHHALTGWIQQQHRRLADAALRLVSGALVPDVRVVAWLLQHEAEALKWNAGRERPDFRALNDVVRRMYVAELARVEATVNADGRGHRATVEAQFIRLLLLDRMGTGVLTRAQVEVLDAWLREGCDALRLGAAAVEGPAFSIDLASDGGLRTGASLEGAPAMRLDVAPQAPHQVHITAAVGEDCTRFLGSCQLDQLSFVVSRLSHSQPTSCVPIDVDDPAGCASSPV